MSTVLETPLQTGLAKDISVSDATAEVTFEYVRSLDGLRAVAVLLVVLFHSTSVFPGFRQFFNNGYLGVDVFFVLSGFLITSILLREYDKTEDINFKNFYARRFLRLMPAYWFHLAILFFFGYQLFSKAIADQLFSNSNFFYAFFYLTNWHRALHGSEITGLLSHTWSLAIEEQFYILWAGLLYLMLRRLGRKSIVSITAAIIVGTVMLRAYQWQGSLSVDLLYNAFNSRMDALLIGCLIGQLISWRILPDSITRSRFFDLLALIAVLVGVGILFNVSSYHSAFLYKGGFTLFALAVGVLVIWLVKNSNSAVHKVLETKPLVWIGKTSYGLYLWHSAALAIAGMFALSPYLKLAAGLLLAVLVTALSYYLVELPFLKMKKRFGA